MPALIQDFAFGIRQLRRNPWMAALAAGSLIIGIGATTMVFTVVDAVLLRPLPVPHPERLAGIRTVDPRSGLLQGIPPSLLRGLLDGAGAFDGVFATIPDGVSFRSGDVTERVIADAVSANYFSVLQVQPFLGRFFRPEGGGPGWQAEVVLSYDFFDRRFGGDPATVGRVVYLNGYPFTVVGISPRGFFGVETGSSWQVRFPLMVEEGMQERLLPALALADPRKERSVSVIGRLKAGVSRQQAEAATEVLLQQFAADDPYFRANGLAAPRVRLTGDRRGSEGIAGNYRRTLLTVMALASVLLLIACANVANLLLTRAAGRQTEFSIRAAMGASRARIVQQLLTESLLLAIAGGVGGVALAHRGAVLLAGLLPQGSVPITLNLEPDLRVLVFALTVSILTAVLFGLAPSLRASRLDLIASMKSQSGSMPAPPTRLLRRGILMPLQIALALTLSVGAAIFAGGLARLRSDLGYLPERILMLSIKPVRDGNVRDGDARLRNLYAELMRRTAELPGVTAVSMAAGGLGTLERPGPVKPIETDEGRRTMLEFRADEVSPGPGFLSTMGLSLLRGRTFDRGDHAAAPVVIISDALERELFGQSSLGRRITLDVHRRPLRAEIVGVVRAEGRFVYVPLGQRALPVICTLLVRADAHATASLTPAIRNLLHSLDRNIPLFNVRTAAAEVDRVLAKERMLASLSTSFGSVALLLVAIGLYGAISFSIARRAREIGLRMALGATRPDVVRLVVRETIRLALKGVAAGLPIAYGGSRYVSSVFEGVDAASPVVLAGSVFAILAIAILAAAAPAMRAATVDPLVALRQP